VAASLREVESSHRLVELLCESRSGLNLIADSDPVRNLLRNRSVISQIIGFRDQNSNKIIGFRNKNNNKIIGFRNKNNNKIIGFRNKNFKT
jgi:hypothetical protein